MLKQLAQRTFSCRYSQNCPDSTDFEFLRHLFRKISLETLNSNTLALVEQVPRLLSRELIHFEANEFTQKVLEISLKLAQFYKLFHAKENLLFANIC